MHSKYLTISTDTWKSVIKKASELPEKDMYLFILRSLANSQQVSYFSIAAFNKEFIRIRACWRKQHLYFTDNTHY